MDNADVGEKLWPNAAQRQDAEVKYKLLFSFFSNKVYIPYFYKYFGIIFLEFTVCNLCNPGYFL